MGMHFIGLYLIGLPLIDVYFMDLFQVPHLINGGAVVDLSRSELQNTSFCTRRLKVPISRRTWAEEAFSC
jgi:hypothetical protein